MEKRKGKLFVMKFKVITDDHQENMAVCNSPFFWHKRMAHQNVNQVKKILRSSRTSSSKNIIFKDQKFCCENCIIGKHRLPFPKNDTKSKLGKLIHADISGPMQENSLGETRYSLIEFLNDEK